MKPTREMTASNSGCGRHASTRPSCTSTLPSFSSIDAPMGGVKQSGLGRRNGLDGLARFTESTTVSESTGLMQLPRTGPEFGKLVGLMVVMLKSLKAIRRR